MASIIIARCRVSSERIDIAVDDLTGSMRAGLRTDELAPKVAELNAASDRFLNDARVIGAILLATIERN